MHEYILELVNMQISSKYHQLCKLNAPSRKIGEELEKNSTFETMH